MTDPEAEVQATANLSPVSPAPVHTAAPRVVPALQDTVDTIDAMVSAAAAAAAAAAADTAAPNGVAGFDTAMLADAASANDLVDDDSLDDAYADDDDAASAPDTGLQPQPELPDSNDDYAKTFDSPMDPEEGGEQGHHPPQHVSSSSMPVANLTTNSASHAAPDSVAHEISAAPTTTAAADAAVAAAAAQGTASPSEARADPSMEPSDPPAGPQQPDAAANSESAYAESQDSSVDIQKLVADLTAQPTEASSDAAPSPPPVAATKAEPPLGSAPLSSSISLPAASSLPPRPPQPQSGAQTYTSQQHAAGPSPTAAVVPSAGTVPPTTSGFVSEPASSLPAPPAAGLNAASAAAPLNAPAHTFQTAPGYSKDGEPDADYQRQWEQFMSDERQYMSDAKWDRFPEGSRIFIGNLSSDKVSKRDVFDVFYKYGRLAQISLKSAYGFVQYHAVDEGRQAMENLQGIEIKGRRIHLEVSRVQDKGKKDRGRSNDRASRRRGEKHQHHQGRDDYRPGRNSPRRNDYHARDENFGRSRGYESARGAGRGRSRSPEYGRNDRDSYRRRSPSPYGRGRHEAELDLPRRYGADVPDVQIILQPEVNRDFVTWVEAAFKAKGLKTEVMYLHPRFPKDQIIQRQAAEGVYGVVDLDLRAQGLGRIPVQAFDRSGAGSNVRFDQYVDLDPNTAAEVIVRAKATAAASFGQSYSAAAGGYPGAFAAPHQQPPHGAGYPNPYAQMPHPQQPQQPQPPQQPPQQQQAPPAGPAADIASFMGQVDNATLQRLLSSMQGAPAGPGGGAGGIPTGPAGYGVSPSGAPQVDIQAILGSLGGANAAQQQPQRVPPQGHYGSAYGAQPPATANGGGGGAGPDAAAQVQNIMAQLARYRQ